MLIFLAAGVIWSLLAFVLLLSFTAEDAPGLYLAMVSFLPASLVGIVLYVVACVRRSARLAYLALCIPSIAVLVFWLVLYVIPAIQYQLEG